jgi:hypothetical protein
MKDESKSTVVHPIVIELIKPLSEDPPKFIDVIKSPSKVSHKDPVSGIISSVAPKVAIDSTTSPKIDPSHLSSLIDIDVEDPHHDDELG